VTAGGSEIKLRQLREAFERVSARLVELEIDSGRQLLEATGLEGDSAARWSEANDALTELWRRQTLLEGLLARADKLRGSRRAAELDSLVRGQSIELATSEVPLASRTLLGASQTAERCSPDELLASMSAAYDQVKAVVVAISAAWDELIPKLDTARQLLSECTALADDLGEASRDDLSSVAREIGELGRAVTSDPLSVEAGRVEAAVTSLEAIRDDLSGVAELKRRFDGRMLEARDLVERLRAAVAAAQAAEAELRLKISDAAPVPVVGPPSWLENELAQIAELSCGGDWRAARQALESWTASLESALDQADQALAANRAPIEARNQLRALLEAYQVKAKRLGVLETPAVAELLAAAREALYTAPTDLGAAAQLVRGYQQALSATAPAPAPEAMP
jgi:hypothetical protein